MARFKQIVFAVLVVLGFTSPVLFACACETVHTKKTEPMKPWLQPNILNSDRIKLKFGSFGVQVLHQNDHIRLSNLFSTAHDEKKIARTIALTKYEANMSESLKGAHEEIRKGGSIGLTLGRHGFTLKKNIFYVGNVSNLPPEINSLMNTADNNFAAIVYDLRAEKDGVDLPYCTIAEVYSPEFLTLAEVQQIQNAEKPESSDIVSENMIKQGSTEKAENLFDELRRTTDQLKK